MKPPITLPFSVSFAMLLASNGTSWAKVYDKKAEIAGMVVQYKVALPKDYDPNSAYPAVLAFPPGAQTLDMVLATMEQNWRMEGDRHGYIVVIPVAPLGRPFTAGGDKIFPEFIEMLLREYKIRDNKLHVAGVSNGGRSAFHIAAMYPRYFLSPLPAVWRACPWSIVTTGCLAIGAS
jgi:predicted peptidase